MIALDLILDLEGGFSNHPSDPGGATMHGILNSEYQKYLKRHNLPTRFVKDIPPEHVSDIYESHYWIPMHLDLLDPDKAVFMFQFGINCGTHTSIKLVQQTLNISDDGIIGPITAAHINDMSIDELADVQIARYDHIIQHNPSLEVFRDGWVNRRIKNTLEYIDNM